MIKLPAPLILASASPRRSKLLALLGLPFTVCIPNLQEKDIHDPSQSPQEYVQHLALEKATNVAERSNGNAIVLGADTIVVLDGEILNKPETADEASSMLRKLSDRTHSVFTGLTLVHGQRNIVSYKETKVSFRKLGGEEIESYIRSGSPMDKAGAYGIQDDYGAVFVSEIHGCYYNIVGLPLELLYSQLNFFTANANG